MKKPLTYAIAATLSGLLGMAFFWFTDQTLVVWLGLGYLFVASIWAGSLLLKQHHIAKPIGRWWIPQIVISILWWPIAIAGGFIGLFAVQGLSIASWAYMISVYGCATALAIAMGVLSLHISGVEMSRFFIVAAVFLNATILIVGNLVWNRFQTPPFRLSSHYDAWLVVILFTPLGALNGWLYGYALAKSERTGAIRMNSSLQS